MELIHTDKGLAEVLRLPLATVRRLRKKRQIPYIKSGHRTHIYDLTKVTAALEKLNK